MNQSRNEFYFCISLKCGIFPSLKMHWTSKGIMTRSRLLFREFFFSNVWNQSIVVCPVVHVTNYSVWKLFEKIRAKKSESIYKIPLSLCPDFITNSARSNTNQKRDFVKFWIYSCFSKMTPLKANQRVLMWLCVCPVDETTTIWKKSACVALATLTIIAMISYDLGSLFYFFKFVSADLEKSLYALGQFTPTFSVLYSFLIMLYSKDKLNLIFANLSAIYRACKDPIAFWMFK